MVKLKVQRGRGKDRREKREKNERGLGSLGSSGSQAINISCRAGKAGLAIFRRRRRLALSQPLTVAGPNYKSPRVRTSAQIPRISSLDLWNDLGRFRTQDIVIARRYALNVSGRVLSQLSTSSTPLSRQRLTLTSPIRRERRDCDYAIRRA